MDLPGLKKFCEGKLQWYQKSLSDEKVSRRNADPFVLLLEECIDAMKALLELVNQEISIQASIAATLAALNKSTLEGETK